MNNLTIIGNVGKAPETRTTQSGKQETTFSVALNRFGKDKDGNDKKPIWVRCRAYSKQAEIVDKYVKKGDKIGVAGKLDVSEWTSRQGESKYQIELVVGEVTLIGNTTGQRSSEPSAPAASEADIDSLFESRDEIPF